MRRVNLPLAALAVSLAASASAQDAPADTSAVYDLVEVEPVLIGGLEELQGRVRYPESARRAGIEGTVYVQFIVDEQGRVSQATCARSPNDLLCDAALAAVRPSQFTPGYQKGKPVKVRYTLPINFRLVGSSRCI